MAYKIFVISFAIVAFAFALISLLKFEWWGVRIFDFPRLQLLALTLIALILMVTVGEAGKWWYWLMILLLVIGASHQAYRIYPYTILGPVEVAHNDGNGQDGYQLSLMVSNVLRVNRNEDKLLNLVNRVQPDLLLTLETDGWWQKKLQTLSKDYPYTVEIPKDNDYGMHLFSKLELIDPEVRYLIKEGIPSIKTGVKLPAGTAVTLFCLHPEPPFPFENPYSTERDAELLLAGREIKALGKKCIAAGDLNDVAWSHTTRLFQKISGTLDPRKGRGFFNTFHAQYPLFRWPLDHIFHTDDFVLSEIKRMEEVGSDHFPIYIKLQYRPSAEGLQEGPKSDNEAEKEADEKIESGEKE